MIGLIGLITNDLNDSLFSLKSLSNVSPETDERRHDQPDATRPSFPNKRETVTNFLQELFYMESPAKKSSVRDKDTRHSIESISQSAESIPRGGGGGIDDNVVVDYKKNNNGNSNNVNDETISDLLSSGEARPFYLAALTF